METWKPKFENGTFESEIYEQWTNAKIFEAKLDSQKKPYTILMPPPNVTSKLHMGHGSGYTMQDILIRWKRMLGFDALWLPGTDHAGIATQMMVEKDLWKSEGKTRQEIGREAFEERLHQWKEDNGNMILNQFKSMGFSCDWSKLAYTMDPNLSLAVKRIFIDLYDKNLIYRGERLVNWDCKLKTAISDDELENIEVSGKLYHIEYPLKGIEKNLTISTTRPETLLGDTAIAVHPDDERYKDLIGKTAIVPFCKREIPIVADDYVKMDFGSGCVKITPAHDPNDFEIGKRHNLKFINILTDSGHLNDNTPEPYRGMDRFDARKVMVKDLEELGLLKEIEKYKHSVPHSERSKTVIEPKLSMQWFVKMQDLAAPAIKAAKSGQVKFYPDLWKKTYFHWLENIQDWCISRQLWWGHRIPVWHCKSCNAHQASMETPATCDKCQSSDIAQDEDVLDTWFSSWLWPISPLGWPEETPEIKRYYPTDVLVTAPEILFLWVARMIMVGFYTKNQEPFQDVFLTPVVCDKKGRKFSKTLGNGIDPMDVIAKYGVDSVRFTAVYLAPMGGQTKMDQKEFEMGFRFMNKIWNAARFLHTNYTQKGSFALQSLNVDSMSPHEHWMLQEVNACAVKVNQSLDSYRINEATRSIYSLIWDTLCDWGIEYLKLDMQKEGSEKSISNMFFFFENALRLLSPICPFITEKIWSYFPKHPDMRREDFLSTSQFPEGNIHTPNPAEVENFQQTKEFISAVRSMRSTSGISPSKQLTALYRCHEPGSDIIEIQSETIKALASLSKLDRIDSNFSAKACLTYVSKHWQIYLPVEGIVDLGRERQRIEGEIAGLEKALKGLQAKLSNDNFVKNAPDEIIAETKAKQSEYEGKLSQYKANLKSL